MSIHIPGKIILLGEHAVLWGARAIAIPAGVGITIEKNAADTSEHHISFSPELHALHDASALRPMAIQHIKTVQTLLQKRFDISPTHDTLNIYSDMPIGAGMGSSAALSLALLQYFIEESGQQVRPDALYEAAFLLEKPLHHIASGIDITTCSSSQPNIWSDIHLDHTKALTHFDYRHRVIEPWEPYQPYFLTVVSAQSTVSTELMVRAQRDKVASSPSEMGECYRALDALVPAFLKADENRDSATAGATFNAAHKLLCELGVSSPELDSLCSDAIEFGALGAKLSGGGGGGIVIALMPDNEQAAALRQHMRERGHWSFVQKIHSARL